MIINMINANKAVALCKRFYEVKVTLYCVQIK